ncbi:hypothetical protein J4471_04860 [Candidatus Woesearchaeota archaeon]|nr:hypothetical protein [Candidatus Woesearchaeota archaeon]
MKIGVDLDEVLADFINPLLQYYNSTYNRSFCRNDFNTYNFSDIWHTTNDQAINIVYDFYASPYFDLIKPVSGSQIGISRLSISNELHVITARPNELKTKSIEWIDNYFKDRFKQIYITNYYSKNGKSQKKSKICADLGIEILIEDSIENAFDCLDQNRNIILLETPWNKHLSHKDIYMAKNWLQIVNYITKFTSTK